MYMILAKLFNVYMYEPSCDCNTGVLLCESGTATECAQKNDDYGIHNISNTFKRLNLNSIQMSISNNYLINN